LKKLKIKNAFQLFHTFTTIVFLREKFKPTRAVVSKPESRGLAVEGNCLIITKGDFSGVKGGANSMKIVRVGEGAGECD